MRVLAAAAATLCCLAANVAAQEVYYPGPGDAWESRLPGQVGMDPDGVRAAVDFAMSHEIGWLPDMVEQMTRSLSRQPYRELVGPLKDRVGPSGLIMRHGYIVAEWGDTRRVDMTFSVTKSYLATVAGLALDRGLIRDVHDPVSQYVHDGGFEGHNAPITWHQMLNQTNEWEGELFGIPDVADRREGRDRALNQPGTFWEYNDVRVNRTALSLLRVFGRALPDVLREYVMDPIGASDTWQWHGYRTSFVEVGGRRIQSVSGGGHWGGGFWASTRDHARFGYLMLRKGRWGDRCILSEEWVRMATTPTDIKPIYGYMWWLNPGGEMYPAASEVSVFARGAGGNIIYIEPEDDLVAVMRWIDTRRVNEFISILRASLIADETAN